jgi:FolB domain-containing protein
METEQSRDKIIIRDLLLRGIIGINDWERERKQDILVNLTVWSDIRKAGQSDEVEDTLNYRTLTKAVIGMVETTSFYLVEALATAIARLAIVEHHADQVRVRVEKPGALRFAKSVGVEIVRRRGDFD